MYKFIMPIKNIYIPPFENCSEYTPVNAAKINNR
jgi:hypothetical protein